MSRAWHTQPAVLHRLVRAQGRQTPDAIAAVHGDEWISYRELLRRSRCLARGLRGLGIEVGTLVGIHLERSLDLPVVILAILEAGGVCVPLEPSDPVERIAAMIAETRPSLIVTQPGLADELPPTAARVTALGEVVEADGPAVEAPIVPDHLAFVHLTSGSTGTPKGVMVSHGTVAARMYRAESDLAAAGSCLAILKTPISNSPFLGELFAPLLHGCYFVIARPGGQQDIPYLGGLILRHNVTHLSLPSAVLRAFLEWPEAVRCRSLRAVYCGGEAVSDELHERFVECFGAARFVVTYGTTEAGHALSCDCSPGERLEAVRIGRAIEGARAYLLDEALEPVVAGESGEIYLGGSRLAAGYLNRPAWTAERFVPDPQAAAEGRRLYRSGDLGRRRPDGELEFKGRVDQQVKIRGHRVELLEIESALASCPGIRDAAVFARGKERGEAQLVAYLVPQEQPGPTIDEIKSWLSQRLPFYMIPQRLFTLDEIPLTHSGKLDRQAISTLDPRHARQLVKPYVPPETAIERILAEIWKDSLGVERVGLEDNFFALGGDSILATGMYVEIERRLHRRISLSVVFGAPNLASLATAVSQDQSLEGAVVSVPLQTGGDRPPIFLMPTMSGAPGLSHKLLACLDGRRPVFALGLPGDNAPWGHQTTLPEIARYCVAAIRETKIAGRVHLMGHSFGGILAYEVARQLRAAGVEVGRVVIIDAWLERLPGSPIPRLLWSVPYFFINLPRWLFYFVFEKSLAQQISAIRGRLRQSMRRLKRALWRQPATFDWGADKRNVPDPLRRRIDVNFAALQSYLPGPYPGHVLLFRPKTRPLFHGLMPDLNWGQVVSGGVEVIAIPGNHDTILEKPNSDVLARRLEAVLERE